MGLDVYVRYSDKEDDYSYGFHTSYSRYHKFTDEILRYFGINEKINFYLSLPGTDYPATDLTEISAYEDEEGFKIYSEYIKKFEDAGIIDLIPLVLHSDCDGSIPWEKAEKLLELLDTNEIKLWFKLESDWEDTFNDLLETLGNAVKYKAVIIYA